MEPQKGGLWHAYRRKWTTERKHLPDVEVARAGGWKNTVSRKTAYQQAHPETILRGILEPGELREAKGRPPDHAQLRAYPVGCTR